MMDKQTLRKVKITVVKTTFNQDLAETYAVPGYPPCLLHAEGQVFSSNGWQKPSGLCDYAWACMREFVLAVAQGCGHILGEGNWLKERDMAIVSCNDGIKPVIFKVEATDLVADVINGDISRAHEQHRDPENTSTL